MSRKKSSGVCTSSPCLELISSFLVCLIVCVLFMMLFLICEGPSGFLAPLVGQNPDTPMLSLNKKGGLLNITPFDKGQLDRFGVQSSNHWTSNKFTTRTTYHFAPGIKTQPNDPFKTQVNGRSPCSSPSSYTASPLTQPAHLSTHSLNSSILHSLHRSPLRSLLQSLNCCPLHWLGSPIASSLIDLRLYLTNPLFFCPLSIAVSHGRSKEKPVSPTWWVYQTVSSLLYTVRFLTPSLSLCLYLHLHKRIVCTTPHLIVVWIANWIG
jgi:hypothetical protein